MLRNFLMNSYGKCVFKVNRKISWFQKDLAYCFTTMTSPSTAGIIVIGDEILKGQVRDTNSHFMSSRLYKLGVRVMRVSVISDDVDEICNEVRKFSKLFTYVITSGGIGPTHDDVTFEGVAKAFNRSITPHPELLKICAEFYNTTDLNSPSLKLAAVPEFAKLTYGFDTSLGRKSKFPNISVENVYIFPGVPPLLEKSFDMLCKDLFGGSGTKFHHTELFVDETEVSIAEQLTSIVQEFPQVTFGSYPQYANSSYKVRLTIEADSEDEIIKASRRLQEALPEGCIVNYDSTPLDSACTKVKHLFSQTSDKKYIQDSWKMLLDALSNRKEGEVALCVDASLSGLTLLHMVHAVRQELMSPIVYPVILLKNSSDHPSSEKFLQESAKRYSLNIKAGPCDVHTAVSCLRKSCPGASVLLAGHTTNCVDLQGVLDSHFHHTCTVVAPMSSWSAAQMLEFGLIRQRINQEKQS